MKPGDLIMKRDEAHDRLWLWRVEGVHLGCVGQEGLVELRSLTHAPGYRGGPDKPETTFVPEPLLRELQVYSPNF